MICWLDGASFAAAAEFGWPPAVRSAVPPPAPPAAALLAAAGAAPCGAPSTVVPAVPDAGADDDDMLPEQPASVALPRTALPMMAIPEMARMGRRPRPHCPRRGRRAAGPAAEGRG